MGHIRNSLFFILLLLGLNSLIYSQCKNPDNNIPDDSPPKDSIPNDSISGDSILDDSLPEGSVELNISNSSLENNGQGWKISYGSNWYEDGLWSDDAHTGTVSALINSNSDKQNCFLYGPVAELKPGMKIQVRFYAKWLEGENTIIVGFHVVQEVSGGAWMNEWKGSVPKDGKWHLMKAEVNVPAFVVDKNPLRLRIGLPYTRWSLWNKPYTDSFKLSKYLIDDISVWQISEKEVVQPHDVVSHSLDSNDPRDNQSRFGVYWTPWRTYARTSISYPQHYNRSYGEIAYELDSMKRAGVKWIRSIWRWDKVEWTKGNFDFSFLDYVVDEAWKRDIRFIPCLHTTPRWASTAPSGDAEFRSFPPNMDDWNNFVYQMVDHFKSRIKYWEIWNEPNAAYWLGTIEDFYELQKMAYIAAKRADPKCKIFIGAYSHSGVGFLDKLLQLGAKDYFDLISMHPYSGASENVENATYCVEAVRLVLAQYRRDDVPIWFTEIGWPTDQAPSIDDNKRGELLNLLYSYQFHESVEKIFWFPFDTWYPDSYGGLIHIRDNQLITTPIFDAYKATAQKE